MRKPLYSLAAVAVSMLATTTFAQVIFYENVGFTGRTFTTSQSVENFERYGFNDRASSVVVLQDRWEVCQDALFSGRCVVLRTGRYENFAAMGLNDRISSVRVVNRGRNVDESRYAPAPVPVYDNRRRGQERLYEADVTSVRAVVGRAEQRCWVEQEQVERSGEANVPGAVAGALLGGVLGHQVGGGRGNDLATVLGAIAGGAIGADAGRDANRTQSVKRCESSRRDTRPDYWDVSYIFRGQEHRVQMAFPPGPTVTVNQRGEPRAK